VDSVEGARRELALRLLLEGLLGESTAVGWCGGGRSRRTGHVDCDLLPKRVVLAKRHVDLLTAARSQAGVGNRFGQPGLARGVVLVHALNNNAVEVVASLHQAVAKVRVLVESELASAE